MYVIFFKLVPTMYNIESIIFSIWPLILDLISQLKIPVEI